MKWQGAFGLVDEQKWKEERGTSTAFRSFILQYSVAPWKFWQQASLQWSEQVLTMQVLWQSILLDKLSEG